MGQLDAHFRLSEFSAEPHYPAECLFIVIRPKAEALRCDPAASFYCSGFGDDESVAAGGELSQMHHVPVGCVAVDSTVLAHGRDNDTVVEA